MAVSPDLLKLITKEGGKELAQVVTLTDKANTAVAERKRAEDEFESKAADIQRRHQEMMTVGVQNIAIGAVVGFGLGGAIAWLAHDSIADYFGRGSWPSLLALPTSGIVLLGFTPKLFADRRSAPGEKKEERAASFGAALGLLTVGGYCSYTDYAALNP